MRILLGLWLLCFIGFILTGCTASTKSNVEYYYFYQTVNGTTFEIRCKDISKEMPGYVGLNCDASGIKLNKIYGISNVFIKEVN